MWRLSVLGILFFVCAACRQEEKRDDASVVTVETFEDLKEALGKRVVVRGMAENAKLSATVASADFVVSLPELESWPDEVLDQHVSVEGKLTLEDFGDVAPDEAGASGPDYQLHDIEWHVINHNSKPEQK